MSNKCTICNEPANGGIQGSGIVSPYSMILTCKDHEEYHTVWNPEIIQKQLGYIEEYTDRMTKCVICNRQLTHKEVSNIDVHQKQVVCSDHELVKDFMMLDMAQLFYEYKERVFTMANPDNEIHMSCFMQWVRAHRSS